ncbi:hypothetical protein IBN27_004190 [Salmonella enterica]|uniref:hypothetical protein n=1 Tax=Salmonella enterica TaxID=28901 RepID=UPI0003BD0CFE|nr:hypothetical protein [Salmonella enterica]ECF3619662.1 hypothetical protein [Salmonella enterica subsp. enterica serovar Braenderup]EDU5372673.1 hypothetical protein [Salmonella enterica subsp. enterica serovar Urbana]EAM2494878.1 hypothetical protein [Salmonella enterica]EAO4418852.1 hypothetical protein [Salmonella enterica]EAO7795334.1 hypothetical protein [Salmonella enterica]
MELDTEFRYPNVIDFFGTTLFHLCHFTTIDLHNYAGYNKYAENNIAESNKRLSEKIGQSLEINSNEYHEDIIDSYGQEIREFGDIYPPMHRKAMVITLYNFFEHQIKTLCSEINKLLPHDRSEAYSLSNVCIKEYRKFLRREAGFDMNQGDLLWKRWEDMLKVEQIRHVLVHSEGEIEKNRAERLADIENYCKLKKGIRLIRHRIIIDEGYVAGLIAEIISLFDLLDRQVNAFIRRYESEHGRYDVPLPLGASRTPL